MAPLAVDKQEIISIYRAFMEEVKFRHEALVTRLRAAIPTASVNEQILAAEFAYLQIRRIIELTALAVLIAHQEFPEARTKAFLKGWNADDLFGRLNQLSDHPYPISVKSFRDAATGAVSFEPRMPQPLPVSQLRSIYNACGERLHVGTLRKILRGERHEYDIGEMAGWSNALLDLLGQHMLVLPTREVLITTLAPLDAGPGVVVELRRFGESPETDRFFGGTITEDPSGR